MVLHPVGVVRSEMKEPVLPPGLGGAGPRPEKDKRGHRDRRAELVIDPEYTQCLDGIDGFSHLQVLWWPHRLSADGRAVRKVHPRGRKDLPLTGIFATRSPARPNPILSTVVELLERRGNTLYVKGMDAVDGTPLVDIKPYNSRDAVPDPRVPEWMTRPEPGEGIKG